MEAARGYTLSFAAALAADAATATQHAARAAQQFAAVLRSAGVLQEVERIRPILEHYRQSLIDAPDEPARQLTVREALRAAFERATGLESRLDSPYARVRFWTTVVVMLLVFARGEYSESLHDRQVGDLRRLQREQAQTIATLAETVRQVQHEQKAGQVPIGPLLRVASRGNVREGPSSTTPRVTPLRSGDMLELVVGVDRWYFVEILTKEGHRTGRRGWVYRRNVRHTPPRDGR